MTAYATPDDVAQMAQEWNDSQLVCRVESHHDFVVPITAQHITRYRYYYVVRGCSHGCGVKRIQEISAETFRPLSTKLDYSEAPNYLSKNGRISGRARDMARKELIERVVKPTKVRRNEPMSKTAERNKSRYDDA